MKKVLLIAFLAVTQSVQAIDNLQFYRAQYFFSEPRLDKEWLTSFDVTYAAGHTQSGHNKCGNCCLLDIYGFQNMQELGQGVPDKDPTNPVDIVLTNIALLPSRDNFAQLSFHGKFSIQELQAWYEQNLVYGFLVGVYVPWRKIEINHINFTDLSPRDGGIPNIDTPTWQAELNLFPEILNKYGLFLNNIDKKGVGDTVVYAGWTRSFHETHVLDYVDVTMKLGGIIPTGCKNNPNNIFDIPLGYNHPAALITLDGSFGTYDWLTLGAHFETIVFFDRQETVRMKTDPNQSGFIKLASGQACVDKGTIFQGGAYVKADHIYRGFSFLLAYSFTQEQATRLSPLDKNVFSYEIVNSDSMFKDWRMHTMNFSADYDFTRDRNRFGPRLGIFYNHVFGGRRIFNTSMVGGEFGVEIDLAF